MSEEQKEESKSGLRNVVRLSEEENPYIASAKERMNDVIESFITNSEGSITLNDFSQIFKTVTVWIKFRLGENLDNMSSHERTNDFRKCMCKVR